MKTLYFILTLCMIIPLYSADKATKTDKIDTNVARLVLEYCKVLEIDVILLLKLTPDEIRTRTWSSSKEKFVSKFADFAETEYMQAVRARINNVSTEERRELEKTWNRLQLEERFAEKKAAMNQRSGRLK